MPETRPLRLQDASMLVMETPVTPMHMGGASLFRLPQGAGKDFVRRLHQRWSRFSVDRAPFNLRIDGGRLSLVRPQWQVVESPDLRRHLFRVALPYPGDDRQLEELIARLHSRRLDRDHPLWEIYLVEGLSDRRFAMYTKIHHALADGATAVRLFGDQFTEDPARLSAPPVWTRRGHGEKPPRKTAQRANGLLQRLPLSPGSALALASRAYRGVGRATALVQDLRQLPLPDKVPDTIFNRPITAQREVGQAVFDFARVKALSRTLDCTINDVALTVCGGALRRYLLGIDALPHDSLVCAVPISLNKAGNTEGGNTVTAAPVALRTDIAGVRERFEAIRTSMTDVKARMARLSPETVSLLTAVMQLPVVIEQVSGRWLLPSRFSNIILSNVPGPRARLYLHGAEFLGSIPVPMILRGMGLNITITSLVDRIWFSYTACPDVAPHIDRLGPLITGSYAELERVMARPQRRAMSRLAKARSRAARG